MIKLCKDCKFIEKSWLIPYRVKKCNKRIEPDKSKMGEFLVAGEVKKPFCALSRQYGPCGIEGKFWEPK